MATLINWVNPFFPAIPENITIQKAEKFFRKNDFSYLPVIRVGKFTGALLRSEISAENAEKLVSELASFDTIYLSISNSGSDAREVLACNLLEYIPVVNENGVFFGAVTLKDMPSGVSAYEY